MVKTRVKHYFDNKSAPLLWRALTFAILFIVISGLLGPRIISSGILYRYHFAIYGGLGKALLFGIISFLLLAQRSKRYAKILPWHATNLVWLVLCAILATYAWIGVNHLIGGVHGLYWPLITHFCLLASLILALVGSFGPTNLRNMYKTYKHELLLSLVLTVVFYGFLELVYNLWTVLAASVIHAVAWLLHLCGLTAVILPPRDLLLTKFGINIAQYCSGIESIALFTALYVLVGLLDWPRFKHSRYFILFPIGLMVLFGFNILRVFILILAGYYINPKIAFSLFHTYAGMVFFILYSAAFWGICYRYMLVPRNKNIIIDK